MLEKTLLDFKRVLLSRRFLLAAPEDEDGINKAWGEVQLFPAWNSQRGGISGR